jgi:methyltransferase, FkbM family
MSAGFSVKATILYNLLIKLVWLKKTKITNRLWDRAWAYSCKKSSKPVTTTIHDTKVIVNNGYTYPVYSRIFPEFNNPLIELVYQSFKTRQEPITLIDIGAAVGDTILLLNANCPDMIGGFFSIDGDQEFYGYLQKNLQFLSRGELILSLLSSNDGYERELVRTHKGTASAQGARKVESATLDSIISKFNPSHIDVLKIDVDGFDGRVLSGSRDIITKHKPAIIFEWHPILCQQTENSFLEAFEVLQGLGYSKYIWFTKYGHFSHFMNLFDVEGIKTLADLCIQNRFHPDWHYDVISLHEDGSAISPIALAEMNYARQKVSQY